MIEYPHQPRTILVLAPVLPSSLLDGCLVLAEIHMNILESSPQRLVRLLTYTPAGQFYP